MKWGLQHVKVTLEEEDSGETVVIEQNSDGRVTCERTGEGRRERAANAAPKAKAEVKVKAPAEPKPEPGRKPEAKDAKSTDTDAKAPTPEKKPSRAKKAGRRRKAEPASTSKRLEWRPIQDFGFDGFGAESGAGMFKVLHTRAKQWALFFEVKGLGAKKIACFLELGAAQDRARELHAKGPFEFEPLSANRIENACPVPPRTAAPKEPEAPVAQPAQAESPKAKAAPMPEAPPASPPPPSKAHAEQDKELLGSFGAELDAVLDEDEDD